MARNPHASAWDAGALLPHRNVGLPCKADESSETAISSSDGRLCSAQGSRCGGGPPPRFPSRVLVQCDNPVVDGHPCSMSTTYCDSPQTIITSSDASCCSFRAPFKIPTASAHASSVDRKPPQTTSGNFARFFVMEGESPQTTVSSSIDHLSSVATVVLHEYPLTSPACLIPSSLALTSPPMSGSVLSGSVPAETDVFSNKCSTVDWNNAQQGHVIPVTRASSGLSEPNGTPSLDSDKLFAMDWKEPHTWKDTHSWSDSRTGHGLHPGTIKDTDTKHTKLKSHSLNQHQAEMCSGQMTGLAKQSECNSSTQPEEQRGSSLHAVQDVKGRCKDSSTKPKEQRGSSSHAVHDVKGRYKGSPTQPEEQRGSSLHVVQDVKSVALSLDEQHSSTITGSAGSGDSLIGLHLGKRTYFQDATSATVIKAPQQKSSSAPKKCRAFAMQTPRCQVQGCNVELTLAKDYHRKHKVCDAHSKAAKVTVANQDQRFCQQCSRFHLLAEFDETKRSCRRRLAGHNERRRKPQPDPLAMHARLQSSFQVWPYLHHSRFLGLPSLYQDSYDIRSSGGWPRTSSVFEDRPSYLQAPSTELQLNFKGVLHPNSGSHPLLVLQSPTEMMPFDVSHPHANESYLVHQYLSDFDGNGIPLVSSSSSGAGVLSGYGATEMVARVTDSGCALSLLSPQTRGLYTPNAVSLDWLGGSNNGNNQFLNEENVPHQQQSSQRGQQQHDYGCIPERSHFEASACGLPTNWIAGSERNNLESALDNGFDGGLGVDNHLLLSGFPEQDRGNAEDGKQTIDLMQMLSSQSQHETTQGVSLPFQLGGGVFGDIQYSSYGSAF